MPKQQMGKHIILVLNDQIDAWKTSYNFGLNHNWGIQKECHIPNNSNSQNSSMGPMLFLCIIFT